MRWLWRAVVIGACWITASNCGGRASSTGAGSGGSGATTRGSGDNPPLEGAAGQGGNGAGGALRDGDQAGGMGVTRAPETCEAPPYGEGGADMACIGTGYEAEPFSVDLYLVLNGGASMGERSGDEATAWEFAAQGIADFLDTARVSQPELGVGLGVSFFQGDCDPAAASVGQVEIAPVTDAAGPIEAVLDELEPAGETAADRGLGEALDYVQSRPFSWSDGVVVVFITDSYATQCETAGDSAWTALTEQALGPSVPIYAIGIDGANAFDEFASGSLQVTRGDSPAEVSRFLFEVVARETRCAIEIPEPPENQWVDYEHLELVYEDSDGNDLKVPHLEEQSSCSDALEGGWYLAGSDPSGNPTKISTCPCTCDAVPAANLEVRLTCRPAQP